MTRKVWMMVLCGVAIVLICGGLRQVFGVFLRPMSVDLQIGREVFGLVIAIQVLIYGVAQPAVGLLADRIGSFWVIYAGASLFALGMWFVSQSQTQLDLFISLGVLVGLGLSGATQVVVLGAVGKVVPDENRSVVFGTVIAATSLGMFVFIPGIQGLLTSVGWRETFVWLALILALVPFLGLGLRGDVQTVLRGPKQSLRDALAEAKAHKGYILLTAGFFVCGFHVTFIATHFAAFLTDSGISETTAAYALGVIGLFNVVGAYLFGALGDKYSKKNLLTALYLARAVIMALILVVPLNEVTALVFGSALGLVWLATVPLTSGIVAQVFGTQYFSMLFGVVFMSHQFGSFGGAWLGGYIYDKTGSYDLMWLASVLLGLLAAALHWPIRDQPLARLSAQPA